MDEIYFYHWVPTNMSGNVLYPLNQLKDLNSEAYNFHVKKYVNREGLLNRKIPNLECLWNDVLHMTAVEPQIVQQKLRDAGFDYPKKKFYKIPLSKLAQPKIEVMLTEKDDGKDFEKWFEPFDQNKINIYRKFPQETFDYYKEMKSKDQRPLVYPYVPHILYKGTIDTLNLEIIEA